MCGSLLSILLCSHFQPCMLVVVNDNSGGDLRCGNEGMVIQPMPFCVVAMISCEHGCRQLLGRVKCDQSTAGISCS